MLDIEKLRTLLDVEGQRLIAQIQANMVTEGANASGETSDSLYSETTRQLEGVRFQIIGNEAFNWIEGGRGATQKSEGGVLYGNILDWVFAKGLDIGDESPEAVAAKITKTIHESGTLLHRLGETRDIYSSVFEDDNLQELLNNIENEVSGQIEKTIINHWSL